MTTPAKSSPEMDHFTEFMRKLVSAPHATVEARLEEAKADEKSAKAVKIQRDAWPAMWPLPCN